MRVKVLAAVFGVLMALGVITVGTTFAKTTVQGVVSGTLGAPADQTADNSNTNRCQVWESELAKQLGIDVTKLQTAQKAAAKAMVDQGVKDGKITAEQATQLKARIDSADWQECPRMPDGFGPKGQPNGQNGPQGRGFPGGPFGRGLMEGIKSGEEAAAKALNMTAADLQTAQRSGKSIADIAKEKSVSLDTVKKAVVDAETAQIDQAVKDGKITADQAAKAKEGLSQRVDNFLQAKFNGQAPNGKGHGR